MPPNGRACCGGIDYQRHCFNHPTTIGTMMAAMLIKIATIDVTLANRASFWATSASDFAKLMKDNDHHESDQ